MKEHCGDDARNTNQKNCSSSSTPDHQKKKEVYYDTIDKSLNKSVSPSADYVILI